MLKELELTDTQLQNITGGAHWGHHWGYGFGSPYGYAAPYGYGYGYPVAQVAYAAPQVTLVPVQTAVVSQGYQVAAPVTAGC